jgi:hypothetical protein
MNSSAPRETREKEIPEYQLAISDIAASSCFFGHFHGCTIQKPALGGLRGEGLITGFPLEEKSRFRLYRLQVIEIFFLLDTITTYDRENTGNSGKVH